MFYALCKNSGRTILHLPYFCISPVYCLAQIGNCLVQEEGGVIVGLRRSLMPKWVTKPPINKRLAIIFEFS